MKHRALALLFLMVIPVLGCLTKKGAGKTPGDDPPVVVADADTRAGREQILQALEKILQDNYLAADESVRTPQESVQRQRDELLDSVSEDSFYDTVNEIFMTAGHGHLFLYRPGRDLFDRPQSQDLVAGATHREEDGYVFVNDVWEGGPAAVAGLQYGDELLPLDDQIPELDPLPPDVDGITLWVRRSRETEPFYLTVEPAIGDTLWYLSEATRTSIRSFQKANCRIGSVHLRTFGDEALVQELTTGAHFNDADGIIIDLRGNRGGEIRLAGEIFDLLTRQTSVWIQYRKQEYSFPATSWNRPFVVLVDHETRSAAEIFAAAVQALQLGTLVGTPTAGQVRGSRLFPLPDGSRLLVPVTTVTTAGGSNLEGRGVIPDVIVPRPLMYAAGQDPPFQRAVEILSSQLVCPEELPPERFPQEDMPAAPPENGSDRGPMR